MDINITINTGEKPKVKIDEPVIKRKKRKLNNGVETILELPRMGESSDNRNILNLLGV